MHGGKCCKNGILGRMLEENVLVFPSGSVRWSLKLGNAFILYFLCGDSRMDLFREN